MDKHEIEKAADIIKGSRAPLMVLPKNPSADVLSAAALILGCLRKIGKAAIVWGPKTPPPGWEFLPLAPFASQGGLSGETRILVDTRQSPISGLRYEKTDDILSVILTPKHKPILSSAVSIVSTDSAQENLPAADCVLALGIRTAEILASRLPAAPQIIFETLAINIDTSAANEKWGEANLADSSALSLTDIGWRFIETLTDEPMSKDEATLVLAGILWQNLGAVPAGSSPEKLRLIAECKERGADEKAISGAITREHAEKTERLAGRMLARKRFEAAKNVSFLMFTPVDFAATSAAEGDLRAAFWFLSQKFALGDTAILLWQKDALGKVGVMALAQSGTRNKILSAALGGKFSGDILCGGKAFDSFQEAEGFILSCLN